ncbi:Putative major facilitator superfamily, MFS transporter superfamily [Septoria linicola]|uniref:Major facilitator superfamily, MFS transporter superfamily n=1 Tax=Septoria linicola TaxID=215465 RepID=A0A9Q9B2R7_9PEZI|nr:putative major facilitator superfamily, MFS transporter superfamily [Septoria linicola]USW55286.1 Putative major facilitator superfamily, MFS transporter superfamily [Septoria linicola]
MSKNQQAADFEKQVEVLQKQQSDGTFIQPTPDEEKKVIRKLDKRLLPLVFVLYSFAVLDRSNLGNARLAGMEDDIDLGGGRYALLGTIFYIAYIISQWTLIGWKQFKPHQFCAFTVVFWGFVATIQAAAFSWGGLMACRFFLGVAEAMFGPGVPLYLTYFYPREMVGFRHGVFISGAAMANAYGGALAYGISQIRGSIAPWRILFLIEGLPTICIAVVAWFFLPDSISTAKFLSDREKQVALHFVARNQRLDVGSERGVRFKEMLEAFKDPKSLLPGFMYFGCNVSFASLPLFLPTIISEMGTFTRIQANGLSAPPYIFCFFVIIILCWLSDRFKMRGPFVALAAFTAAIGFIINATTTATGPRYFSTFLSVCIFASVALLLAWTANIHSTESKRGGGYVILATIGQCGPLLGTNIFPSADEPLYRRGLWVSAGMCLMVAVVAITLSLWIIWENRKLAAEGVPENQELEDTSLGHDGGRQQRQRIVW